MSTFYQVHQFAELAGVTVKALHHYDRLGLLRPKRTGTGYRLYSARDLERLEQIIALKFLGLPLKQIKVVLERGSVELTDALRMQRQALEEKQRLLGRAIQAIEEAERSIAPGQPADPLLLKKLIEVIGMQDSVEAMKKYYSEETWAKTKKFYEEGPSAEWVALYRDAEAVAAEDPAAEKAQAVAARWVELLRRDTKYDPQAIAGNMKAWMDFNNWPESVRERLAGYKLETLRPFIHQALMASQKRSFLEAGNSDENWEKLMLRVRWFSLLFQTNFVTDQDPGGAKGQALARRWNELSQSGGGPAALSQEAIAGWLGKQEMVDVPGVAEFLRKATGLLKFQG